MSSDNEPIVFNRTHVTGSEFIYMHEAIGNAHLASSGFFSRCCARWLESHTACRQALLTHSCTAALEMAFTLAEIGPGDEVIMPSFTFVSTANAVVGRGGTPVFVDVRPDTLCIDERQLEARSRRTPRRSYRCTMPASAVRWTAIGAFAEDNGLFVIEDAAQALGATVDGTATRWHRPPRRNQLPRDQERQLR